MISFLIQNPLLLLFLVAAVGYPLGRLKIRGSSLGVAAVLFVGLAVGALHPDLKLPEVVYTLGLVLFVYTIGLSSGPGFVASFRRKGWRDNLLVLGALTFAVGLTVAAHFVLDLKATLTAGLFAGSLTNTPALAGVLEAIKGSAASGATLDSLLAEPVVGYSIAYPMGVLGTIITIYAVERLWRVDYGREAQGLREAYASLANRRLFSRTIRVYRPEASRESIEELSQRKGWDVIAYATVYPLATIAKIIFAQLLWAFLR